MLRKKRVFIPIIIAVILVLGIAGGVVAAKSSNNNAPAIANTVSATTGSDTQETLMARVAGILGIDESTLQAAFDQAQSEIFEERLDARLSELVANNKITQEQADAYKDWLKSRPDFSTYRSALEDWLQSNPISGSDVGLPGMGLFRDGKPGIGRLGICR